MNGDSVKARVYQSQNGVLNGRSAPEFYPPAAEYVADGRRAYASGSCLVRLVPVRTLGFYLITLFLYGCGSQNQVNPRLANEMPQKMLWAWERPEDLRFIDTNEFGVAFLAQTIYLESDDVILRSRRQPLEVPPGTYLVAVTRIETQKEAARRPTFSPEMAVKTAALIRKTLDLPDAKGMQVDFDAVSSERSFYRSTMGELRKQIPEGTALTMTSLASWCTGDAWFNDFPVDEAVPMVFQMGADDERIKAFLRNGNDWREPLCRGSYGITLESGPPDGMRPARRIYYFKNEAWKQADLKNL